MEAHTYTQDLFTRRIYTQLFPEIFCEIENKIFGRQHTYIIFQKITHTVQ